MPVRHKLYYDLMEVLPEPECPVCYLLQRAVGQFIENLLYENINNFVIRQQMVKSRGFCARHAWQIRRRGDPLAHAILYTDQLVHVLRALGMNEKIEVAPDVPAPSARSLSRALEPEAGCLLCEMKTETERMYLQAVADYLIIEDFARAYSNAFGLCRPHVRLFMAGNFVQEAKNIVARRFLITVSQLLEALAEVKRKADYRFADETRKARKDIWVQAVRFWTGSPDVF